MVIGYIVESKEDVEEEAVEEAPAAKEAEEAPPVGEEAAPAVEEVVAAVEEAAPAVEAAAVVEEAPAAEEAAAPLVNTAGHEEKIQVEVSAEKTAFCRCWKSQKFPYCDGSHRAYNAETGSNVAPVVVCCQQPVEEEAPAAKAEEAEPVAEVKAEAPEVKAEAPAKAAEAAKAPAKDPPRSIPVSAAAQKQDKVLQDTKKRVKQEQRPTWPIYAAVGVAAVAVGYLAYRRSQNN